MELSVGAFTASLNAQIGEHGGDKIESIEETPDGYVMTAVDPSGGKSKLLLNAATADTAVHDAVGDEIAMYSIMENIAYMTLFAGQMMSDKKISDVPQPILVADIIKIAEEFDNEHGTEMVGQDTAKALKQFTEEKLLELYGQ